MEIGDKIKRLRLRLGLTQDELAARTELSKGFISQLERDLTSPSIATLMDILEALGTNVSAFFSEQPEEKISYGAEDMFVKENPEMGCSIQWLVTNAQKNALEPILVTLEPGGSSEMDDPHEGEEFGYVIAGSIVLQVGERQMRIKKGGSFYFHPSSPHGIRNNGRTQARVVWISTPPSF